MPAQLQCADKRACRWRWMARRPAAARRQGSATGPAQEQGAPGAADACGPAQWQEVGAARVYTPGEADLGGWLRVECTPVARRGLPCAAGFSAQGLMSRVLPKWSLARPIYGPCAFHTQVASMGPA